MNPHLKLAYDHGVQKALEDAGIKTSGYADILRGGLSTSKDYLRSMGKRIYPESLIKRTVESRPVSALTGSRMKNLTGEALEAEKRLVDIARSGSLLGTAGLIGLGVYGSKGEVPESRIGNTLKRVFGE
jgi:hypothetical protein